MCDGPRAARESRAALLRDCDLRAICLCHPIVRAAKVETLRERERESMSRGALVSSELAQNSQNATKQVTFPTAASKKKERERRQQQNSRNKKPFSSASPFF